MVADLGWDRPVFDVVGGGGPGRGGSRGGWAREDLDHESVGRARVQLAALFDEEPGPRRLLVYLGGDCFVDLRGLRLLLDLGAQLRCRGGALVVVAPPLCLTEMLAVLDLAEALICQALEQGRAVPLVDSVRRAAWWARTSTRG